MLSPPARSFLLVSFILAFAQSAFAAQSQAEETSAGLRPRGLSAQRISAPIRYAGTYEARSGAWSRGRAGVEVLYNCTFPGNYFGTVGNSSTGEPRQMWIDDAWIEDRTLSRLDQIQGFDFSYCSTDYDPSGNSGSMLIAFYDDYTPCAAPTSSACSYVIPGLPLSTSGNLACWSVGVDLSGGLECTTDPTAMFRSEDSGGSDRRIGIGFMANPLDADRNDTGPVLATVCLDPMQNQCSLKNQNFFYWEDPSGYWTGCYWFGGVPWSSFDMKIFGPEAGSFAYGYGSLERNGSTRLTSTEWGPGRSVRFDVEGYSAGSALYLVFGSEPAPELPFLWIGTLVVSHPFLSVFALSGSSATFNTPLSMPDPLYSQVIESSGPLDPGALISFSNGLMLTY